MIDLNSTPSLPEQNRSAAPDANGWVIGTQFERREIKHARPSVDMAIARDTWERTESFFRSIQRGAIDEVLGAYLPDAILDHPIIGRLSGQQISQLWTTFLKRTRTHRLAFTITHVTARTACIDWHTEHEFFDTGRPIQLSGASALTFQRGGIRFQHDRFDRHAWSAQAMGISGLLLSYLPGSRAFLREESRRAFGLAAEQA
jgi:hypothetical protein